MEKLEIDLYTKNANKFERGLIIGAFNPLHNGHEYLFQKAQEFCKLTDVYVGCRRVNHRLPRKLRAETVRRTIENNNWSEKFNIIESGNHKDLNFDNYHLFITGTDILDFIAGRIYSRGKEIGDYNEHPLLSLHNMLAIHRREMPLTEKHRQTLIGENIKLIDCSCSSKISGSKIRKAHYEGKDISKMVSQNTWEIIKDYVNIFNN